MSTAHSQHPLVAELEAQLLPALHAALLDLERFNPAARASVFASSVGSSTKYQGFSLGISCVLPGRLETEADEIALVVSLCQLDREPRLNVEVVWGHPSARIEMALANAASNDEWPLVVGSPLSQVVAELPRFVGALDAAVQRGHP